MAENKNQHYVPQFYLRNFSPSVDGRDINLFNINGNKHVFGASLKQQCSKGYFYGKNSLTDRILTAIESSASGEIKSLITEQSMARASELLRLFISVQKGRTFYAIEQSYSVIEGMRQQIALNMGPEAVDPLPTKEMLKHQNVRTHVLLSNALADLSSALLVNQTQTDFITSDDPVVVCNRFFRHTRQFGVGFGRPGIEIYFPISPSLVVLLFDGNVWSPVGQQNNCVIEVRRSTIVDQLNELQVLNCHANLYYRDNRSADAVGELVARAQSRRTPRHANTASFFSDEREPGRYTSAAPQGGAVDMMLVSTAHELDVAATIRFLRRSVRPRYFDDGSAQGPIRDRAWGLIVEDFADAVEAGRVGFGDLDGFAQRHPEASNVLPRKRTALQLGYPLDRSW